MRQSGWIAAASFALVLAATGSALAFGTVRGVGQNAEHERITRHALACAPLLSSGDCFEEGTLVELAGKDRNFGAVGIPDRGELVPKNRAHCDSGDYLDIPGYPHSRADAQAALEDCRAWMMEKLNEAVADAGELVDGGGHLRKAQLAIPCLFVGQMKGRAKCNVIEDFGVMLHTSEDFYSHTNWVDQPDPALPVGPDNPPGLGNTGRAPWLDLRHNYPFPNGLLSGCFENVPEKTRCNYGGLHRVKHTVVNKDEGTIDPIILSGTTQRGRIADNFAKAVNGAIDDTRDKWATLKERLATAYGAREGALMACAISHDHPLEDCQ